MRYILIATVRVLRNKWCEWRTRTVWCYQETTLDSCRDVPAHSENISSVYHDAQCTSNFKQLISANGARVGKMF